MRRRGVVEMTVPWPSAAPLALVFRAVQAEPWRERALCAETDPEAFFPEPGGDQGASAKRICNGDDERRPCPVRTDCLRWALGTGERFGIWGGLSERERRRVQRRAS